MDKVNGFDVMSAFLILSILLYSGTYLGSAIWNWWQWWRASRIATEESAAKQMWVLGPVCRFDPEKLPMDIRFENRNGVLVAHMLLPFVDDYGAPTSNMPRCPRCQEAELTLLSTLHATCNNCGLRVKRAWK